jgi:hypothetical protein
MPILLFYIFFEVFFCGACTEKQTSKTKRKSEEAIKDLIRKKVLTHHEILKQKKEENVLNNSHSHP